MYDNKVRLSPDVIQKAELIAAEWGLKNARAAIEAVFRRYSDDYLHGRERGSTPATSSAYRPEPNPASSSCAALDELDDLLSM